MPIMWLMWIIFSTASVLLENGDKILASMYTCT